MNQLNKMEINISLLIMLRVRTSKQTISYRSFQYTTVRLHEKYLYGASSTGIN